MTERRREREAKEAEKPAESPAKGRKLLRAALFFAGSAVFGGLAVALWDRKTLTALRRRDEEPPRLPDDEIY